jgi:hypothetical protein
MIAASHSEKTISRKSLDLARSIASQEDGMALLIALIALSTFSLLGFYMIFNSTTELKISDNYESQVQARYAAQAGLNHARELIRGIRFNYLLQGPDGTASNTSSYRSYARTAAFRNFLSWNTARSLNILDPTSDVSSIPDDGLMNTGKYLSTNGTILIPSTGIAQTAPNPYGAGTITTSRYFVKVTDNNGEASEILRDPGDDPFVDGDGIILVRSVGVAQTIREDGGGVVRRNSVAVFEARFQQRKTFALDAPVVVQGTTVTTTFDGNSFDVDGGGSNVGIATIDTNLGDGNSPETQVEGSIAPNQYDNVTGTGYVPGVSPSVSDITGVISANEDQARLLDQEYLYNFTTVEAPTFADNVYNSNQTWAGGSAPNIGTYNPSFPPNHPSQIPKITLVNGDLSVSGNIAGGGVLIITGAFTGSGTFNFNGIVLVVGKGIADMSGMNTNILGGIYVVNVTNTAGVISFGTSQFSLAGNSDIIINSEAIKMGTSLLPAAQTGFREIISGIDP